MLAVATRRCCTCLVGLFSRHAVHDDHVCVCVLNCDCFSDFLSLFSLRTLRRPGLLPSHSLTDSSALCHRTCRLLSSVQFSSVAFCLPSRADRFAGRAAKLSLQRRLACLLSFFYFFFVLFTHVQHFLPFTHQWNSHTHSHSRTCVQCFPL